MSGFRFYVSFVRGRLGTFPFEADGLRGVPLAEPVLPAMPVEVSSADARTVAAALADSYGGHVLPAAAL
jgi:hypothetical protein